MLYHTVVVDLLAMSILSGSLVLVCMRVQKNYSITVANRHLPVSNKWKPSLNKTDIKVLVYLHN